MNYERFGNTVNRATVGLLLLVGLATTASGRGIAPADDLADLRAREAKVKETLAKVTPAVVSVTDRVGAGSGVIVSEDGLVLTAGHVLLTDQEVLTITLWDGRTVEAKPLGRNLNVDAGMVQIVEEGKYPFVPIGETKTIEEGDWCIAIGHPGGYQLGRTPPVRLGRVVEKADWMLVTDCAITGGDSGGPLFDLDGELIGINSSIGPSVAENRHSRIDEFTESWDRMASGEAWGRLGGVGPPDRDSAYLGVHLDLDAEQAVVLNVIRGSAAEDAGLEVGDVILQLDDVEIDSSQQLIDQVAARRAGVPFSLRILRNGRGMRLRGRLGRYDDIE